MLALFAAVSLYAADLNIYASGLKATQQGDSATLEYVLNTDATGLSILLYPAVGDPISVPVKDAALLSKGAHSVAINLSTIPGGQYAWGIKAESDATQFVDACNGDGMYNYYLPQDVVVDNNYESPFFGRIYVSESTDGASDGGSDATKAQTRGFYIYNADLTFANGDTAALTGYDGGLGGTRSSRLGFKRAAIDANGYVYVASRDAATMGVYRMDPANPSANFVQVLAASATVDAVEIVGDELYTMEGVTVGAGSLNKYQMNVIPVDSAVASLDQTQVLGFGNADCDAAYDGRGGFWFAEHRYSIDAYPCLAHMNAQGVKDFEISASVNTELLSNADGGASYRGVVAVNPTYDLVAIGSNRRAVVFTIGYDSVGAPVLTKLIETGILGGNIDGLAFDVANNLYVASASSERFYAFPLAKEVNAFVTPAPAAQVLTSNAPLHLVFKDNMTLNNGDNSNAVSSVDAIFKFESGMVESVSGCSKLYNARNGYGIKFGTGSAVGTLTIHLASAVRPDSIVFRASAYSANEGAAKFMGDEVDLTQYGNKVITPYTKVFDGNTDVETILIETTSKRMYVTEVIIYCNGKSDVALDDYVFEADEPLYLNTEKSVVGFWTNDKAKQVAHFYNAGGEATDIVGEVLLMDPSVVKFTAPAGAFRYVSFSRHDASTDSLFNQTALFDLRGHVGNIVDTWVEAKTGNGYNSVVWASYVEPALVYSIKHPWGTGLDDDWSWKECEEQTDGTWQLVDVYGGTGCNIQPAIMDSTWIAQPTLVGNPSTGDSCLFVINPNATTLAEVLTITNLNPNVVYKIKHPWNGGDWTWKECEEQADGTWKLLDIYGGNGCNIEPTVLDQGWIASPVLVGNPFLGDSCSFVIDPNTADTAAILTITKLGDPNPEVTVYEHLYEIGDNQGWKPSEAIEMTQKAENIFEGTFEFTKEGASYFAFITVKPETDDWTLTNANRFGGATNNELVVNDGTYDLAVGELCLTANPGTYTITVNLNTKTASVKLEDSAINNLNGEEQVTKVIKNGQLYIIRNGVMYTATGARVE